MGQELAAGEPAQLPKTIHHLRRLLRQDSRRAGGEGEGPQAGRPAMTATADLSFTGSSERFGAVVSATTALS